MKSTERQKFEENWKDAFEGSEMTPSDSVWSNIDLKLDNEKMKRRVVYYQRLTAASILFALLIGVGGVRYFNGDNAESLATQSTPDKNKSELPTSGNIASKDKLVADNKSEQSMNADQSASLNSREGKSVLLNKNSSNHTNGNSVKSEAINRSEQSNSSVITFAVSAENFKKHNDPALMDTKKYLPLASQPFENLSSYSSAPVMDTQLPDVVEEPKEVNKTETVQVAAVLTQEPVEEIIEQKKKRAEDLWLSFGAAAGSYNPGSSSSSSVQTMSSPGFSSSFANQATPQSTRSSVGAAFSLGLSVGKKVAERWLIQTGVNYLSQAINYTSNFTTQSATNEAKASLADYAAVDRTATPMLTQPYKVNSNMEFVSIPVQAGYIIIDRKIGLQLNAGFASDIFLRNTLKDQSGQSHKYSQSGGEESPYRSFNWAGLASTELSYKMAKQYRISLQPGFRYSLQPALKSQSGANPLVLDIGFRFRYIFQ